MADIDKSLPNVRHEVKIPPTQAPTDVNITEEQQRQPVEVTPDEEAMQGLASTPEYATYRKEYKWQT